jgi:hypothetical protein
VGCVDPIIPAVDGAAEGSIDSRLGPLPIIALLDMLEVLEATLAD